LLVVKGRLEGVIDEVGGGLCHVAAITGWADPAPLAGEGDDTPLAATRAESTAEPEAEDAALEIAAESGNTHDQRVIHDNPTRRRPIAARFGSGRSSRSIKRSLVSAHPKKDRTANNTSSRGCRVTSVTNNVRDLRSGELVFPDISIMTPAGFLKTLRRRP
jgi:hypothetical protein